MIDTFKKKKKRKKLQRHRIRIRVIRFVNKRKKKGAINRRDKADATRACVCVCGSVQGVGVQVPRKVLAVPPSGEGEPQCRRDAKVKRVAARQERISGARGLGHSPLPCTVERAGVIARHWTLPLVTLSTTVAPLRSSGWSRRTRGTTRRDASVFRAPFLRLHPGQPPSSRVVTSSRKLAPLSFLLSFFFPPLGRKIGNRKIDRQIDASWTMHNTHWIRYWID